MLAGLSGTIINRSQVGRSLDVSEKSIRDYLQIAEGSYFWRNILSYAKSITKSVVKMPKGHFRDNGLSHYVQSIINRNQLMSFPNVRVSFEAFISDEIIKEIQATDRTNWNYFRIRNGVEVDMILDGPLRDSSHRNKARKHN